MLPIKKYTEYQTFNEIKYVPVNITMTVIFKT